MTKAVNPRLRAAVMDIVHNQLRDGTPPATRETLERLMAAGRTRDEAKELIACVVCSEVFDILKKGEPYNESRFVAALAKLPQLPWDED